MTEIATGLRVGEYVLDQPIGDGAFSTVWLAHHHYWVNDSDKLVAIKIPKPAFTSTLLKDAAVHGLKHPNIVRILGFDPFGEVPYLIMEYVPGLSLRALMLQQQLTPSNAVSILRQILLGLSEAHKNGFVHRDIKPENILIHQHALTKGFDSPGVVKIADFGIGKTVEATGESIMMSGDNINSAIVGTIGYMSPEQKRGGEIDHRTDLYACAVLLYEMLTGNGPDSVELPSEINSQSPRYLDEVFRKGYAKLELRYQSADEFAEALTPPDARSPGLAINSLTQARMMKSSDGTAAPMQFVCIPAGSFLMGSAIGEIGRREDESQHRVTIARPYFLSIHHVTRGQFAAFAVAKNYRTRDAWRSALFPQDDNHPVVSVSWHDAVAFCEWLSGIEGKKFRLPTEAEWELACRNSTADTRPYNTGDAISMEQANYDLLAHKGTTPVGSFPSNARGLFDMHGNAWQWCADWYERDLADATDPQGPVNGAHRVLRGGSWCSDAKSCRSVNRYHFNPTFRHDYFGFRVAMDVE